MAIQRMCTYTLVRSNTMYYVDRDTIISDKKYYHFKETLMTGLDMIMKKINFISDGMTVIML